MPRSLMSGRAMLTLWSRVALLSLACGFALSPAGGGGAATRYADGAPKGKSLTPFVVRLRTAALRKPLKGRELNVTSSARRTARRASRLVRAARDVDLPPSQASDLVDSIPTKWSARKRSVAVELTHAFAANGVVVRRGTFASLVGACRRAGELDEAEALLGRLHSVGLCTNPNVYAALMGDLCRGNRPDAALGLEASMRAAGATPSNETLTVLLSSLLRARAYDGALRLAHRLRVEEVPRDLPLYNVMLLALLASEGEEAAVGEVLEQLRATGLSPSAYTLNVLLKGFTRTSSGLAAALDIFNAFSSAGGVPGTISYNILLAGFAREGQLINCEVLLQQLRAQSARRRRGESGGGGEKGAGGGSGGTGSVQKAGNDDGGDAGTTLAPDVYTYNAMVQAAIAAGRPRRALAYGRLMRIEGIGADVVSLSLLADAYTAAGQPLRGLEAARAALDAGEIAALDEQASARLLHACAAAGRQQPSDAADARAWLLWTLRRMLQQLDGQIRCDETSSTAVEALLEGLPAFAVEAGGRAVAESPAAATATEEERAAGHAAKAAEPPWHARPAMVRDVIRTLGAAGDFGGAQRIFEATPRPRARLVWEEMISVCNLCAEPAFASEVLRVNGGIDVDAIQAALSNGGDGE